MTTVYELLTRLLTFEENMDLLAVVMLSPPASELTLDLRNLEQSPVV